MEKVMEGWTRHHRHKLVVTRSNAVDAKLGRFLGTGWKILPESIQLKESQGILFVSVVLEWSFDQRPSEE